jgi:hypothetical protein
MLLFAIHKINIGDFTESNWTTCFQETAEVILGKSSEEVGNLKNSVRVGEKKAAIPIIF